MENFALQKFGREKIVGENFRENPLKNAEMDLLEFFVDFSLVPVQSAGEK